MSPAIRRPAVRALYASIAVVASAILTTCADDSGCAGNPMMPVCADPPAEPQIVFLRAPDANWAEADIYTSNSDGSNVRRLTFDGLPDMPAWSPDSRQIAYARYHPQFPSPLNITIQVMDADGSNPRDLSAQTNAIDHGPDWSPDGSRIVFFSNRHNPATLRMSIYVMNADGSNVVRLTKNDAWNDRFPRWSPDGTRIAFNSNRVGGDMQIFVMNADGTQARQLTSDGVNVRPRWSPDGRRIAFEGMRGEMESGDGGMGSGIYVMNADGSGQMNVSNSPTMDMNATWSSDGRRIYFCSGRPDDERMTVWVMNSDGSSIRELLGGSTEDCCPMAKPGTR